MTRIDEDNSDNGRTKKPCMLPTGEQAKLIVELLAAMYLAVHNSEDTADDEAKDQHTGE